MTKSRVIAVIAVLVVVVVAGVWYVKRAGQQPAVIDLVEKFPEATKQQGDDTGPDNFVVKNERIGGQTLRAIYAHPTSRITWKVTAPTDGWLKTYLGVDEQAWNKDGDGVLFMIGVRDLAGGPYQELLRQQVDPHGRNGDRRWVPVTLDLSPFSGRVIEIYFNTRVSMKGSDARNDFSYWGTPGIYLRP